MSKARRNYNPEEKVSILKRYLVSKESVADICDDLDITPTQFYRWQKEFFDNAALAFQKKDRQSNSKTRKLKEKIEKFEPRLRNKKNVITDFFIDYHFEGYRRLTYVMMDEDIVAVSPASVYRVLKSNNLMALRHTKPSKKGKNQEVFSDI